MYPHPHVNDAFFVAPINSKGTKRGRKNSHKHAISVAHGPCAPVHTSKRIKPLGISISHRAWPTRLGAYLEANKTSRCINNPAHMGHVPWCTPRSEYNRLVIKKAPRPGAHLKANKVAWCINKPPHMTHALQRPHYKRTHLQHTRNPLANTTTPSLGLCRKRLGDVARLRLPLARISALPRALSKKGWG